MSASTVGHDEPESSLVGEGGRGRMTPLLSFIDEVGHSAVGREKAGQADRDTPCVGVVRHHCGGMVLGYYTSVASSTAIVVESAEELMSPPRLALQYPTRLDEHTSLPDMRPTGW